MKFLRGPLASLRQGSAAAHARSSIWGMAEYFAYPLMMFLATPLFLRWLGEAQYGQWMLLLTFNGLGGLAGLGMGSATTRDVAAARGRDDAQAALRAVRAAFSVSLLSGLLVGVVLIVIGMVAGADLLRRMGDPAIIRMIVVFAAAMISLEQLDTVFAGALRGFERFDLSAGVEATSKAILVVAALVVSWLTRDVRWVMFAAIAATLLRLIIKMAIVTAILKRAPWPSWDRAEMAKVFAFGKWTWLQSMGAALFSTADRFLIGGVLGAEALARYSVCLQLAQQVQTIPAAGAQFLFPAVSRRREAGEDFGRLAWRAGAAIAALGFGIGVPLALLAEPLLRIWVGHDIATSSWHVLSLLAVAFAVLAASVGPFYVLLGGGHQRWVTLVSLGSGIAASGLAFLLIPRIGVTGAIIGRFSYSLLSIALTLPPFASITSDTCRRAGSTI